ncbi:hypothetical protein BMG00_03480 [Thioclava marina]|jgi:hypothetical protein|uniref:Pilus assembly protein n=1 Tax=Thioclava marina TaxID=1915077 RepID=A0ABX3MP00_9RHOB|nr:MULTISPECIES: hypothetical protein [Thioclava]MBD3802488.1 hypothetical protein [Thioclava sp.]OOY12893.1 hypothetical protein BMG00_03480 [Thioclava marina]OOY28118.1 hypothetical protein BMI90_09560 [Thioclava sp. L04-15]TNE83201.1 MAG: hypothetical protein EP337_16900 [Paracoccaceae bacterium]
MALSRFRFRRFGKEEHGSIPIEGVMGFLLLAGWLVLAFEIYDAFRMRAKVTRATSTVADIISRERDPFGPAYVMGMKKIFDYLAKKSDDEQTWMRVTIVRCWADPFAPDAPCNGADPNRKVTLVASDATNIADVFTQAALDAEADRIPVLAPGDTAAIVETSYSYHPLFGIGDKWVYHEGDHLGQIGLSKGLRFSSFIVTRPRGNRFVWDPTK